MNHLETSGEPFYYVKHALHWQAGKWCILLSSLMLLLNYRSTDYGTTYEKLNDKVGLKTILSYLYVCPTNKRKVRSAYSACCLFMMWLLSWLAHLSKPPKNPLQLSFKRYKDELMDVKVVKCPTHHNFQISSCECRRERGRHIIIISKRQL